MWPHDHNARARASEGAIKMLNLPISYSEFMFGYDRISIVSFFTFESLILRPMPDMKETLKTYLLNEWFKFCHISSWAYLMTQMVKNLPAMQQKPGLIPGLGRSPGEGNDYPLQYSCLKNSTDRETWWAIVYISS